ncbi:cytochrome P450 [Auraticoccus sp. F435]|uniref:Cytochrome P450 n=1 Tax=Auraticoccus cholistanensis TaxID=2656650 RepID=A0A6A9UU30_9ACTN|nr:cytochrome P450 [Auraticoccus cholistanensis]MVA75162.1 cytochrome P450 [Auraticoccus cholistanensis]
MTSAEATAPAATDPGAAARRPAGWHERAPALLRDGYSFVARLRGEDQLRLAGADGDVLRIRLMGRTATVIRGEDAARFFYTEPSLRRGNALPELVVGSLFGHGAVHTLDGPAHQHRKTLFTTLTGAAASGQVCSRLARLWDERAPRWTGELDLFTETSRMLTEAGTAWLGLELAPEQVGRRARDLVAMVDGFGSVGARQLRARTARARSHSWVAGQLRRRRAEGTGGDDPLAVVASFRDADGELLPLRVAAVETLNLLRPLVAVSWLVAMSARALESFPAVRRGLVAGSVDPLGFAQEVRRVYPFAPLLAARPTQDVSWQGVLIPAGSFVVLDLWGTDHDPRLWPDPDVFDPGRFAGRVVSPYDLVPQGGGSAETGHRCPGEDLTLAVLMTLAPRLAASGLQVVSPLAVPLTRMPPEPSLTVRAGGSV